MDLRPDRRDEAFRAEVRAFVAANRFERTTHWKSANPDRDEAARWARRLDQQGWMAPHWPVEWGGKGWAHRRIHILQEELCAAFCPEMDRIALDLAGPAIIHYGSAAQQQRYLPPILRGEEFWCQGFSEPQAGSDVSLAQTRAELAGDTYTVNGTKIWITNAHIAHLMLALVRVRAGGKAQTGLSLLIIEMKQSGVRVRPVITIDGGHVINEVTLENVRVPRTNLIGEEGKGWTYARFVLSNERLMVAAIPHMKRDLAALAGIAARTACPGGMLESDPVFRRRFAALKVELEALEFAMLRLLSLPQDDMGAAGLASTIKIRSAELRQAISEAAMEALGEPGLILDPDDLGAAKARPAHAFGVGRDFVFRRAATIAGGTTEIQKNIIAALALEM